MKPRFLLLLTAFAVTPTAWAQEAAKTVPPVMPAADPQAVRRDLYDLALLRDLQVVNFDTDQIKVLQTVVKETLDADKARRKKDDDAMRDIAADVRKARDGAVAGEPIPVELVSRCAEIQKAVLARVGTAKREAVEKILAALYPMLTATQKTEMDKQSVLFYGGKRVPAAYRADPKKAPREEVLKLAAGAFVENVLLDDRMPTLLESLKPLKDPKP